jgi:hypothetical protein
MILPCILVTRRHVTRHYIEPEVNSAPGCELLNTNNMTLLRLWEKFRLCMKNIWFNTVFAKYYHWAFISSQFKEIYSFISHFYRQSLILSSHKRLHFPSSLFTRGLPPKFAICHLLNRWHIPRSSTSTCCIWTPSHRKMTIQRTSRPLLATCFHAGISLGLFFEPEDGDDIVPRNVTFNGLRGVISQKVVLFNIYSYQRLNVIMY